MEKEEVERLVNEFLVEEFEVAPQEIKAEANLKDTLDLDSLDFVDLVVVIESNFGFKVAPEDFTEIISFQNFYDYIYNRLKA